MKHSLVLIACASALAACNKGPEIHETNASVADVVNAAQAAGVSSDNVLHAGQWRLKSTMDEMNIPGLPASAQAEMKGVMGEKKVYTVEYCLSAEEAKHPRGKFFTGKESDNCKYDHFDMAGGRIDAVMRCEGKPSGSMKMTVSGTYSPDSYTSRVAMEMSGGREGGMTMKMHSEAHRIGECTDKEAKVTIKGG
jgi:hypothetical protein